MADIWFDVDVALAEVPVNRYPLIDDTDFKSIEDAVAYNAAGMALNWHFVTTAGAYTVTAVTPTTGGNYDWTDQGTSGVYTIEIPASGGASINNDTEGFGWFTGVATGILPWASPIYGFRAAALNNSLIDGTTIDVNVTALGGTAQSATDLKDFADTGYDPSTHKVAGVVLLDSISRPSGTIVDDAGNSTTVFKTNLTSAEDDYIKDAYIKFTSGANINQVKQITAYNGTSKVITTKEFTDEPAENDTFVIINE